MNKFTFTILLLLFPFLWLTAQDLNFYWANQYGNNNTANDIQSITTDYSNHIIAFAEFNGNYDIEGNAYSSNELDLLVYQIDEDGNLQWSFSDGGDNDQYAQKVSCDVDGNIYLMGKFKNEMSLGNENFTSNGSFDMFVAKLNSNGDYLWVKTFGGPKSESFIDMQVKHNKITLAGRYYEYTVLENDTIWGTSGTDTFLAQLDLDGNLIRSTTFGGESVDVISHISMDELGFTYITGDFYQSFQIGDYSFDAGDLLGVFIAKLNSNFDVIWAQEIEGNDLKPGLFIDTDSGGDMVIAGNFSGQIDFGGFQVQTADFDEDIFSAQLDTDGNVNWLKRFYSNSMETVAGLNMDRLGNIYLSGQYLDHIHFNDLTIQYNLCCGNPELFFVKFEKNGNIIESTQMTGERSNLKAMSVPENNQVILAGQFAEEFSLGELELNSPTSFNVFISYLKDDTWLNINSEQNKTSYLKSTISAEEFELSNLKSASQINVFNVNGQLIEQILIHENQINLGKEWRQGAYFIQIISANGKKESLKVFKL